ncbi:MAG: hypothetical protein HOC20_12950 [Chloroflexi bacterium]|nr:hypothetical protein [Chloroflexota bacterium]
MPKPKAYVDYNKCNPELCKDGVCLAAQECELKILHQDAPYEPPETTSAPCKGCFKCLRVCPAKAIVKM